MMLIWGIMPLSCHGIAAEEGSDLGSRKRDLERESIRSVPTLARINVMIANRSFRGGLPASLWTLKMTLKI